MSVFSLFQSHTVSEMVSAQQISTVKRKENPGSVCQAVNNDAVN